MPATYPPNLCHRLKPSSGLPTLPVELVSLIFIYAVHSSLHPQSTLHALLSTSWDTHKLTTSTPQLYTHLDLDFGSIPFSVSDFRVELASRVNSFLSHSGTLPLHFSIRASTNRQVSLSALHILVDKVILNPVYQKRWEELHIVGIPLHTNYVPLLHAFHDYTWPALKSLRLDVDEEDVTLTAAGCNCPVNYIDHGLTAHAPNLRHLSLNLRTSVSVIALGHPAVAWHHLRNLEMNTYTTNYEMLRILSSMPNIQTCDVRLHGDLFSDEKRVVGSISLVDVSLPHLRRLTIRTAPNLYILPHISAPSLRGLYVEMMDDTDTDWDSSFLPNSTGNPDPSMTILATFLSSNAKTLSHVKLVCCPLSDAALSCLLSNTPLLRELRVWWGPSGSILDALAEIQLDDDDDDCDPEPEREPKTKMDMNTSMCGTHSRFRTATPTLVPHLEHLELLLSPNVAVPGLYERTCWVVRTRRWAFMSQWDANRTQYPNQNQKQNQNQNQIETQMRMQMGVGWLRPPSVFLCARDGDKDGRSFDNDIGQWEDM